jgi:hypothetical protein
VTNVSLQNLLGISLEQITPQKETVRRLLNGAVRHIADAKVKAISAETRFSSAYTAIRMLADVGLHAHGYRTLTSKPGHHQTAIQTLPKTLGVDSPTLVRLDKLRKQRNLTEYTGDIIPESAVAECLSQAESLHIVTLNWLREHKAGLV